MRLIVTFVVDIDPERVPRMTDTGGKPFGVVDVADYVEKALDSTIVYDGAGNVVDWQYLVLEE